MCQRVWTQKGVYPTRCSTLVYDYVCAANGLLKADVGARWKCFRGIIYLVVGGGWGGGGVISALVSTLWSSGWCELTRKKHDWTQLLGGWEGYIMLGTHGRHIKCEKTVTNSDFIISVTLAVYHKVQSAGSTNYLKKISENIIGMYVLLFTILVFFRIWMQKRGLQWLKDW